MEFYRVGTLFTFFIWIIVSDAQTCFKAKIKNGSVKMRMRGRMAIYRCSAWQGYIMHGNKVAVCLSGRWSHPPPKCIAAGCPEVVNNTGLMIKSLYDGKMLSFSCPTAYKLQGPVEIFCDKTNWDQQPPTCQEIPTENTTMAAASSTTSLPDTTKATTTGAMTTPKPPTPKPTTTPKPPTPKPITTQKPPTPKPPTPKPRTTRLTTKTTLTPTTLKPTTPKPTKTTLRTTAKPSSKTLKSPTLKTSTMQTRQTRPNPTSITIGIASGALFAVIVIAIFAWVWAKKKRRAIQPCGVKLISNNSLNLNLANEYEHL